jgi:hypothetical protein
VIFTGLLIDEGLKNGGEAFVAESAEVQRQLRTVSLAIGRSCSLTKWSCARAVITRS